MNDLVKRLSTGTHPVVSGRTSNISEFKECVDRRHLLLKFTDTRGGTELGVKLEEGACDFSSADFEKGAGRAHIEGNLKLDYVPVRLVADIDLGTLTGTGHLEVLGPAAY